MAAEDAPKIDAYQPILNMHPKEEAVRIDALLRIVERILEDKLIVILLILPEIPQ